MNLKKISIILITIISIFSFNNKVDAAVELECLYPAQSNMTIDAGNYDWINQSYGFLIVQNKDGSQKYFFGMKAHAFDSEVWYYAGEKKSDEYIRTSKIKMSSAAKKLFEIYISADYRDDKEFTTCPKYAKNEDRDTGRIVEFYNDKQTEPPRDSNHYIGRRYNIPKKELEGNDTISVRYMNYSDDYSNDKWLMNDVDEFELSCLYANLNLNGTQLENDNFVTKMIGDAVASALDGIAMEDGVPFDQIKTVLQIDMKYGEIRVNSTLNAIKEVSNDQRMNSNVIFNQVEYKTAKSVTQKWQTCPKTFYIHSNEQWFREGKIEYKLGPDSNDNKNGEIITLTLVKQTGENGEELAENAKKINFISTNDISNCKDIITDEIADYIKLFFNIIRIGVPIIIVALTMVDISKSIFNGEEDMKKTKDKIIKRLIIAAAFFLVPTILKVFLDIVSFIWPNIDSSLCGIFD